MQHTVKEMTPAVGASVLVRFESIQVACVVKDAKNSWCKVGKVRILIAPVSGGGEQWIEMERLVVATTTASDHLKAFTDLPWPTHASIKSEVR